MHAQSVLPCSLAMLRFFQPIRGEEAEAQQRTALQQSAAVTAAASAVQQQKTLLKRGPGRPRKAADAHVMLAAASSSDSAAAVPPAKRGKYNNWFASPYIHDILDAYRKHGHSSCRAVDYLQRTFPRLDTEAAARFADLREVTLRSWHDQDGVLLERYQQLLVDAKAAPRGGGYERLLGGYPAVNERVKRILLQMRERGAVVNVLVIRFVMRSVVEADADHLMECMKFSHGFISQWAREQLGWSWRAGTTPASKLPSDWEESGVLMAKRIALNMQIHKVRSTCTAHAACRGC